MGGSWYIRWYVYEEIKQIRQDYFTYHVTLSTAKRSEIKSVWFIEYIKYFTDEGDGQLSGIHIFYLFICLWEF